MGNTSIGDSVKVAVTGATGFIGRYVVRRLATREGVQVVAVSRTPPATGVLPSNCTHICLDLAGSPTGGYDALGSPDVLIHLAWSGLPNHGSLHHFDPHLFEQYRFIEGLVTDGLPSIICAGTCFEYGMRGGELAEDLLPDPQNPYGFAKDALRRALSFLRARRTFNFAWARLFYMYGEGQAPNSIYSQVMRAIKCGETSFKMSAGEQLRDYLHVMEVADILVRLALEAPDAGIVNVCSGKPVSIRGLVERWLKENGWSMNLDLGRYPYPPLEPMAFWGSTRRLAAILERSHYDKSISA